MVAWIAIGSESILVKRKGPRKKTVRVDLSHESALWGVRSQVWAAVDSIVTKDLGSQKEKEPN